MAHCSAVAPAGVSQTIDQAPCVAFTLPDGGFCSWAVAEEARLAATAPNRAATHGPEGLKVILAPYESKAL